jgi:hypothetical protein
MALRQARTIGNVVYVSAIFLSEVRHPNWNENDTVMRSINP